MKVTIGPYPDHGEQEVDVQIDNYDTWSMDSTLAHIILPMLKQLQATKHGAPSVDPDDVPIELYPTIPASDENGWVDNTHFARWDWVLNEMIFAMENINADWEDQFWEEHPEIDWDAGEQDEEGNREVVWVKEGKCDWEGLRKYEERISKGCLLFGKYFRNLWD